MFVACQMSHLMEAELVNVAAMRLRVYPKRNSPTNMTVKENTFSVLE